MDIAVAVGATPIETSRRSNTGWRTRMPRMHVALSAKSRVRNLEQPVVHRAVRFMAVGAILENRSMLPEKRPPPLGMASIAIFVYARLLELRRIRRAMRIVAIGANDLALPHRHVRRAHQLRLELEVALTAHFYFSSLVEERSLVANLCQLLTPRFLHYGMAVDAGDAAAGVRARFPVGLHATLVAAQARVVLNFGRLTRVLAKRD